MSPPEAIAQEPTITSPPPEGPPRAGDGLAVASLVLGILACLFFWLPPFCGLFAVVSVFLGRVAQRRMSQTQPARAGARSWATAGITLSLTGVLVCVASYAACFVVARKFAADGKKEYGKAIQELERDPEFEKNVKELREELDKLDDKPADTAPSEAGSTSHKSSSGGDK